MGFLGSTQATSKTFLSSQADIRYSSEVLSSSTNLRSMARCPYQLSPVATAPTSSAGRLSPTNCLKSA